jgi:hypothetical protein
MLKFSKTMKAASNSTESTVKGFWKLLLLTYDIPVYYCSGKGSPR